MPGKWPTFIIAGAPRSGTTSLYRYLRGHPEVHVSPIKETHFFDDRLDEAGDDPEEIAEAEAWYRDLFGEADETQARGEATPAYFYHPDVPDRIRDKVPEARILILLRDPVERAQSHYLFRVREGYEDRPFVEFLEAQLEEWPDGSAYLRVGLYHRHVERYVETLGRDQVKILLFEDLKERPLELLRDVAGFLDVDPGPMSEVDHGTRHNPYGESRNRLAHFLRTDDRVRAMARAVLPLGVRVWLGEHLLLRRTDKPDLDPEAVRMLLDLYREEVEGLEEMLDRDLPELKRTWDLAEQGT